MKKILTFGAMALALSSAPALADHHGGDKKGGMFEKHDTNGDGVITEDEFVAHAKERFSKMDADGDGKFSKEEAQAVKEKMREKFKERKEMRKEKRDSAE